MSLEAYNQLKVISHLMGLSSVEMNIQSLVGHADDKVDCMRLTDGNSHTLDKKADSMIVVGMLDDPTAHHSH